MIPCLSRAAMAAALFLAAASALAADLTVHVDGLADAVGEVRIAVFDQASGFPSARPKTTQAAPAAKGRLSVTFKDLAPGRYAVAAFQDKNGNQRLDANMVGLPTEPYGFSNDARGAFGPPKFADAAVTLAGEPLATTLHLK